MIWIAWGAFACCCVAIWSMLTEPTEKAVRLAERRIKINTCPRVAARVACYECGYPMSEAMYMDGPQKHVSQEVS